MPTHSPFRRRGPIVNRRVVALACGLLLAVLPVSAAPDDAEAASAGLAREFMAAFAAKDMERVGAMFAPNAVVQRARLGDGEPELVQLEVADWLVEAADGIDGVQDFRIEVLDSASLAFDDGVTVSVRFRATGSVGEGMSFVNDGVDTFSLVSVGGAWRIVLYNSFEKLRFAGAT